MSESVHGLTVIGHHVLVVAGHLLKSLTLDCRPPEAGFETALADLSVEFPDRRTQQQRAPQDQPRPD